MIAMTFIRAVLAGFIVSFASVLRAETAPVLTALSDSAAPLDERRVRERLGSLAPLLAMDGEVTDFDRDQNLGTATGPTTTGNGLPPAVLAKLKGTYETSITQIQAQISKLKPDDHEGREMLTAALARSVQSYTQMYGTPPPGVSASGSAATPSPVVSPAAVEPAKPRLKRPVIGARVLSATEAIVSLRKMLELNSSAAARAAFAASPHYRDARQCSAAAAGALTVNRVTAALAAWLRAHELEPKNPVHLINLAGLTTRVGMPRHTLALLDAADKLGRPGKGFVTTARVTALNNRGHALVQLKRFAEAETVLREAVKLAPGLGEARVNLAHALYQQNDHRKKSEAEQLMRFARWRKAQPPVAGNSAGPGSIATSTPPAEPGTASGVTEADFDAERKGRLPASAVFDLSRGKPGGLPTIKIPRTIGDGHAMYPKIQKLQKDLEARMTGIVQRMIELDDIMRRRERSGAMSVAGANRARDVFWYIANTQSELEFRGLWREIELASRDPGIGLTGGQHENPWASRELDDKYDRIRAASMKWDPHCQAMWDATVPFHGSWQGPIRRMETAINRYYHVTYPHMTALAANLGDSVHHEYAMLMIEQKGLALMHYIMGPLHTVGFFDTGCVQSWGLRGEPGQAEEPQPGQFTEADMCGTLSKDGYKAVFDLEVVELSINCEKVGAEVSAGQWVKLFGELECTYDGEVTIFMGGAVEGEIPFIGVVETGSKAGGYVTIDFEKGIVDAGVKSTESIKVGIGPVGIEREIEHTYVIASFGGG